MLLICDHAAELFERGVALITASASQAIAADGRFTIALSGGETPRTLYRELVAAPVDWSRVHFFWGDERAVPPASPRSNYRMAKEALLSHIRVPGENVHRILAEKPPEEAAADYEKEIEGFFGGWPRFHLTLLGLGADGHTASLFPGSPALEVKDRIVVAASERISLTAVALNRSARIVVLASGAEKAAALAAVLEGPPAPEKFPAQLIRPESGEITWLVDAAAASLIQKTHA